MSRSFVEVPLLKLKYVNNIKHLPTDVIEIIKSFCFIDFEEVKQIRYCQHVKAIANQLIKCAFSRNSSIEDMVHGFGANWAMAEPIIDSNSNFWIFGFSNDPSINEKRWDFNVSPYNYLNQQTLQLQGENCTKCGEFSYLSYSTYPHTHSNTKICECSHPHVEPDMIGPNGEFIFIA